MQILKKMFSDQCMVHIYSIMGIYYNIYLYKFLKEHETKYIAIQGLRKRRLRNFIPAQVGLIRIVLFVFAICLYSLIYGIGGLTLNHTVDTGKARVRILTTFRF